jgi:hypothetical protein
LIGRSTNEVIQPFEVGELEISLDTRRFVGRKTFSAYLQTDNGKLMETILNITIDAQDPPLEPIPY